MVEEQCSTRTITKPPNNLLPQMESSIRVEVNTPSIPSESAHLYPRLAGSNWTCYLSIPIVVVGRSEVHARQLGQALVGQESGQSYAKRQRRNVVHIDYPDCKAISRRHCEFRFSARRDRWELYVYGRNGVKVDHVLKRPGDRPVFLKTGTLIEISNTRFVFILPNQFIRPSRKIQHDEHQQQQPQSRQDSLVSSISNSSGLSEGSSSYNPAKPRLAITSIIHTNEERLDSSLETAIAQLFRESMIPGCTMSVTDITDGINGKGGASIREKPVSHDDVLHILSRSHKFQRSSGSTSPPSTHINNAEWILATPITLDVREQPTTGVEDVSADSFLNYDTPASTATNADKTDTASTTLRQYPSSLSGILRELDSIDAEHPLDSEWPLDFSSVNQPLASQSSSRISEGGSTEKNASDHLAAASGSCSSQTINSTNATISSHPYSAILPDQLPVIPASAASTLTISTIPSTTIPSSATAVYTVPSQPLQQHNQEPKLKLPRFGEVSIESIYSVWSAHCSSTVCNTSVNSRREELDSDGRNENGQRDSSVVSAGRSSSELDEKKDIYHQIRTRILFS